MLLPAANAPFDPLDLRDLSRLLTAALDESVTSNASGKKPDSRQSQSALLTGTLHACYGAPTTSAEAAQILTAVFPGLEVRFNGDAEAAQGCLSGCWARRLLDWVPAYAWTEELNRLTLSTQSHKKHWLELPGMLRKLVARMRSAPKLINKLAPWLELALFGGLTEWLVRLSDTYASYKFVDFRLLFVILMGHTHGTAVGVCASILACISYGLGFVREGNDAMMLLYNTDNWMPFACYMLAGGLFGYMRSKQNVQHEFLQAEFEQQHENAQFLQSMYVDACNSRDVLQEQVTRSRDSYGRIYSITSALDSLQPAQVCFAALSVLEDAMDNNSIAIYTLADNSSFARLMICSKPMRARLDKSLDLKRYPLMGTELLENNAYANRTLEPGYPAYCVPLLGSTGVRVRDDGQPLKPRPFALIAIWDAKLEQRTLNYQNLLSVVCGLAQSSLVRASAFSSAVSGDVYEDGTRIMTRDAFAQTLKVYSDMYERHVIIYLLLNVETGYYSISELDERLSRCMRATDIAGRAENGALQVLLLQAEDSNLDVIERRFSQAGIKCMRADSGSATVLEPGQEDSL